MRHLDASSNAAGHTDHLRMSARDPNPLRGSTKIQPRLRARHPWLRGQTSHHEA